MTTTTVATPISEEHFKFIGLVLEWNSEMEPIPTEKCGFLVTILIQAGFPVFFVEPGLSRGERRDGYGDYQGMYTRNDVFPYRALGKGGVEHTRATVWLNALFQELLYQKGERHVNELAGKLHEEIERSTPLEPIVLTKCGEVLREHRPVGSGFVDHSRDFDKMDSHDVGTHDLCGGSIGRRRVSPTHNALYCKSCGLRVLIPKTIETFGDLRRHFVDFNPD